MSRFVIFWILSPAETGPPQGSLERQVPAIDIRKFHQEMIPCYYPGRCNLQIMNLKDTGWVKTGKSCAARKSTNRGLYGMPKQERSLQMKFLKKGKEPRRGYSLKAAATGSALDDFIKFTSFNDFHRSYLLL